jgi:hypothetical protein
MGPNILKSKPLKPWALNITQPSKGNWGNKLGIENSPFQPNLEARPSWEKKIYNVRPIISKMKAFCWNLCKNSFCKGWLEDVHLCHFLQYLWHLHNLHVHVLTSSKQCKNEKIPNAIIKNKSHFQSHTIHFLI